MTYIALRDFDGFKKGDPIPEEIVQDRLIRGKKIGLVEVSEIGDVKEIKEELITEIVEVQETQEEILLEDSSNVSVEVKEEIVEETPVKETKKSKK